MEKKIGLDETPLIDQIDQNTFIIHREEGFLSLGNSESSGGFKMVKSILDHTIPPENYLSLNREEKKNYISALLKEKNIPEPAAVIINTTTPLNINREIVTQNGVTAMVTAHYDNYNLKKEFFSLKEKKAGEISLKTIVVVDRKLDHENLLNLFTRAIEAKLAVLWDLNVFDHCDHLPRERIPETLLVACNCEEEVLKTSDVSELDISVQKCVREATVNVLKNYGFPQSILDVIAGVGVTIEDLVEAGMELCVGVEKSKELNIKLQNQIMKSLEDINVISLVLAGIRLEEDYERHRISGVDVEDDPAFLYADEVLGMAIANQIAGTKALFNFKRYDEEKPGIISTLGPILDDVFAGMVAGCMSKIFED